MQRTTGSTTPLRDPADACVAQADRRFAWLDVVTADADDAAGIQQRRMPIEYDQIDAGKFSGRFLQLAFQGTLVAAERQSRTMRKRQRFPADYCIVSLIRSVSGQGRCGFDTLSPRSVGYMPGSKEYEILLLPSEIVFFWIQHARFIEVADTLGHHLPGGRRMLFVDGLNPGYLGVLADATGRAAQLPIGGAAQALIGGSPEEPLTVINLCRELGVSRASLQRSFLQVCGVSPLAYLRMRGLTACGRRCRWREGRTRRWARWRCAGGSSTSRGFRRIIAGSSGNCRR